MTIKQLQYIIAVTDNSFNISLTAEKLYTSQPGISKQIKILEESLKNDIFLRNGKALVGLTDIGEQIVLQARIILAEYDNLLRITSLPESKTESLDIATTPTQSNYILPEVLNKFHKKNSDIRINIQDGNIDQLIEIAKNKSSDCIILSGINAKLKRELFPDMLMIPCYEWHLALVCHNDHPLVKKINITIDDIVDSPIVTYPISKNHGSVVSNILKDSFVEANIFATSNDPNTIKNYARQRMGVGIVAPMAFDHKNDYGLTAISLENIFPKCTTIIAVERFNILKPHVLKFIKIYAPHLTTDSIDKAINETGDIVPQVIELPEHTESWVI